MKKEFKEAVELVKKIESINKKIPDISYIPEMLNSEKVFSSIFHSFMWCLLVNIGCSLFIFCLLIVPSALIFGFEITLSFYFYSLLFVDLLFVLGNYFKYKTKSSQEELKQYHLYMNEKSKLEDKFDKAINRINIKKLDYTTYTVEEINILMILSKKHHRSNNSILTPALQMHTTKESQNIKNKIINL